MLTQDDIQIVSGNELAAGPAMASFCYSFDSVAGMVNPVLQVTTAFGTSFDDPTEDELFDVLSEMNLRGPFVIACRLDREPVGQHYMGTQVYLNSDKSCRVEFRDGGADRHFQATVPAPFDMVGHETVACVLRDWAFDRPGWREALDWRV